jgi:hypothetical protein
MNERIKELCSQAISDVDGIQNPDTQHMYIPDCFRDRFAELIVRECFDVVIADGRFHDAKGVIRAGKGVAMEHFGVEE